MVKRTGILTALGLLILASPLSISGQNPLSTSAALTQIRTTQASLMDFLQTDQEFLMTHGSEIQQEFADFIDALKKRKQRYNYDLDFLKHVYYKVHRKYLDHYNTPSSFADLFEKKRYDCLTGTALYAMIFQELGFNYQITETTYHIYLTLQLEDREVLIESTNPLTGFVEDPALIKNLIQSYRTVAVSDKPDNYQFQTPVFQHINLQQLAGLHFYNLALASYNKHHLQKAILQMEQALLRYNSNRLNDVMRVMIATLMDESSIDEEFKQIYLTKYRQFLLDASVKH